MNTTEKIKSLRAEIAKLEAGKELPEGWEHDGSDVVQVVLCRTLTDFLVSAISVGYD